MDKTRKRCSSSGETDGILSNITIHGSRTNMQAQQQLMASVSSPAQYYCSARRAICSAIFYVFPCIFLDNVASNIATNRWNSELSEEQKALPLPDIIHDSFELPDAEHIIHELLRELPLVSLGIFLVFGFILPYDVMGRRNGKLIGSSYRRYEACTRYFETRSVLELMRALSVWVTTQADPHGLHCKNIETHTIGCIFTTFTFARCGDNLYSGHASNLLSLAVTIQTYFINLMLRKRKDGGGRYQHLLATVVLWTIVLVVAFYVVISRMHYTVDVLMSFFLVPTVWLAWSNVSWPTSASSTSNEGRRSSFKACKNSFLDLAVAN
jgi:hypothetical protein